MSLQVIVRGESRTVRVMVTILTGPVDRTFFCRVGRRGQLMRFESEMTPDGDFVSNSDGSLTGYLVGLISEAQSASLVKGPVDVTVYATNPLVRLVKGQANIEDEIGDTTAGVL